MNCDHAFDCLTDPARRNDEALQSHLDDCPRCRDMAEVLSPALDLFGDAITETSGFTGPWSQPDDTEQNNPAPPVALPRHAARKTAAAPWKSKSKRRSAIRTEGLKVALFMMVIVAFTVALAGVGVGERRNPGVTVTLPDDCQRSEPTDAAAKTVVAGCVSCHVGLNELSELTIARRKQAQSLVQRCVTCHLGLEPQTLADTGDVHAVDSLQSTLATVTCSFQVTGG